MAGFPSLYGTAPGQDVTSATAPTQVVAPDAAGATSAYTKAITDALNPTFQNQNAALEAQLAGQGILSSGAASKQLQDLTAQQGATIAGQVAPLIQQGFGQQYGAAQSNAGYQNALQQQLNQFGYGTAQANADRSQQANLSNQSADNALLLAQLGFGNQGYQNATGTYGSLLSQGLGSLGGIVNNGMNNAFSGYTLPQTANLPYASGAGAAAGYGTPKLSFSANGTPIFNTGTGGGNPAQTVVYDPNGGQMSGTGSTPLPDIGYTAPPTTDIPFGDVSVQ